MKLVIPENFHRPYFWMFSFSILGSILMPFPEGSGLTGTWFVIGWPLPTLELKVGSGIYYEFSFISLLFSLLNVGLWLAVYFGVLKLIEKYFLPDWLLYPGVVIFFSLNILGFLFLGFYFLCCLLLG